MFATRPSVRVRPGERRQSRTALHADGVAGRMHLPLKSPLVEGRVNKGIQERIGLHLSRTRSREVRGLFLGEHFPRPMIQTGSYRRVPQASMQRTTFLIYHLHSA